jgi:hypothetical protein
MRSAYSRTVEKMLNVSAACEKQQPPRRFCPTEVVPWYDLNLAPASHFCRLKTCLILNRPFERAVSMINRKCLGKRSQDLARCGLRAPHAIR